MLPARFLHFIRREQGVSGSRHEGETTPTRVEPDYMAKTTTDHGRMRVARAGGADAPGVQNFVAVRRFVGSADS